MKEKLARVRDVAILEDALIMDLSDLARLCSRNISFESWSSEPDWLNLRRVRSAIELRNPTFIVVVFLTTFFNIRQTEYWPKVGEFSTKLWVWECLFSTEILYISDENLFWQKSVFRFSLLRFSQFNPYSSSHNPRQVALPEIYNRL